VEFDVNYLINSDFSDSLKRLRSKVDNLFFYVLLSQWTFCLFISVFLGSKSWNGPVPYLHPHIIVALLAGGAITIVPIYFIRQRPGTEFNMYLIGSCQMFFTILIIHLTGGRIESHFHVFGSLAFLTFYRSIKVIALATGITLTDHLLRGYLSPMDIYGTDSATIWRSLEHGGWVLFMDAFLISSIRSARSELLNLVESKIQLQKTLDSVEMIVKERTRELEESQAELVHSSRYAAMGEMASGVAHEINNPLAVISATTTFLKRKVDLETIPLVKKGLDDIDRTVARIVGIVSNLRSVSKDAKTEVPRDWDINFLFNDVLGVCGHKFKQEGIDFKITDLRENRELMFMRKTQITQVLLNLVTRAYDSVKESESKLISVTIRSMDLNWEIEVMDTGHFQFDPSLPMLGLSVSRSIMRTQGGDLLTLKGEFNSHVIRIPKPKVDVES